MSPSRRPSVRYDHIRYFKESGFSSLPPGKPAPMMRLGIAVTDPTGQVTTLAYSGGKVSSVTDPAGRVTQLEYDASGNLQRVRGADATAVPFAYDA